MSVHTWYHFFVPQVVGKLVFLLMAPGRGGGGGGGDDQRVFWGLKFSILGFFLASIFLVA